MLWIIAALGGLVAVPCHEVAHVLTARLYGGRFQGVRIHGGRVLVQVTYPDAVHPGLRLTALAGPVADALLALAMVAVLPGPFKAAALWPLVSFACNILPLPGADGRKAFA